MGQISAKICRCEAFSIQMWPTPPLNPQATLKAIYDNQKLNYVIPYTLNSLRKTDLSVRIIFEL